METTGAPEHRIEPRSNLFVMATLYTAGGSSPVRLRNMSRSGALIEGAVLPPVGSAVRLCRGSLSVAGHVVWVDQRKAGLRFKLSVTVADWLPNGKPGTGQQRIDELVHQARLGAPVAAPQPPAANGIALLHDELLRLSRSLECAAEILAADAGVAAGHAGPLQIIDVTAQALAKLAAANAVPTSTAC